MYVIYKENFIPGVGGTHPQGIEVGLAYYQGWNLANCPIDKVHDYKEFDFISVTNQVARGLQVLDSTTLEDVEISTEGDKILIEEVSANITLSEQDKLDMEAAKTFINNIELKLVTRAKVREMKDLEDDLVDVKRLAQTLITFTVDDWKNKPAAEKDASKFKSVMENLSTVVSDNIGVLSTIEKDLQKIEDIVDLEVSIAKVVDEYYLTKKL